MAGVPETCPKDGIGCQIRTLKWLLNATDILKADLPERLKKLVLMGSPFQDILPSHEGIRRTVHPLSRTAAFLPPTSWMRHPLKDERTYPIRRSHSERIP